MSALGGFNVNTEKTRYKQHECFVRFVQIGRRTYIFDLAGGTNTDVAGVGR